MQIPWPEMPNLKETKEKVEGRRLCQFQLKKNNNGDGRKDILQFPQIRRKHPQGQVTGKVETEVV